VEQNRRRIVSSLPHLTGVVACFALAAAAFGACSNTPAQSGTPQPSGGTGNVAGSTSTGGGGTTSAAGGAVAGGGAAGSAIGGSAGAPAGGSGGGGGAGGSAGGPACKAVTPLNGSGLTLNAADISAFKYAASPAANIVKMDYDPVGHMVVMLTKDGKLYGMDPNVALPTTAVKTALTTATAYDSGGYTANVGYTDHRGLAFGPDGSLYVLAVLVGDNSGVNIKKGTPGAAGSPRTWTTLVTTSQGFAAGGTDYDHSFSGIAVSPDGMSLYFSSGSRTEHGETEKGLREVPLTSAILKVPSNVATDLKNDETALKPFFFADGTRNAYDLAFNAAGDLIGTDNGPDIDLPDEVNFLEQGKHYGFPWRFGNVDNPVRDAAYTPAGDKRLNVGYGAVAKGTYVYDAAFPPPPAGVTFADPILNLGPDANVYRADRMSDPAPAGSAGLAGVTGHRSPLGIVFDVAGALCGDYYRQGFLLSYGAVVPSALGDLGNDLLLLSLTKQAGAYTMHAKQIAKGISGPIDSVLVGNRLFTTGYGNAAQVFVFALPTP
jgi:hypothetical protein